MNTEVFENYESSVRSYCRRFPTVFKKSKGAFMYDENGEKYIDFFCGAGAVNYGHNNDYIKPKLIEYIENDGIMHALDMYTTPKRELIEYLEENILKPRGLNFKVMFPGPTGTNAIEAALKLARKAKGADDVQPPTGPQKRPEQKCAGGGRLRQRQDPVLAQAQPFTMSQFLCSH